MRITRFLCYFFNKNIKVTNTTRKIADKDIIGIYYFTDYNSSIDKELSHLGLTAINYEIISTSKRIALIVYENYFYILLITMLMLVIKISYTSEDRRLSFKQK